MASIRTTHQQTANYLIWRVTSDVADVPQARLVLLLTHVQACTATVEDTGVISFIISSENLGFFDNLGTVSIL